MSSSTDFAKYVQLGAYHWAGHASAPIRRYDPEMEAHYLSALKLASRALGGLEGRTVLDAGCGDGVLLELLARRGAAAVGLDAERVGLELARQELEKRTSMATLVQGVCQALPLRSSLMDAVFAVEVIEHLDDPERFLSEASRVLRRGGVLVVTTPRRREDGVLRSPLHSREFTRGELASVITQFFPRAEVFGFCHPLAVRTLYGVPGLRDASLRLFKRFSRAVSNPCAWLVAGAPADRCESLAGVAWRGGHYGHGRRG